MFSNCSLRVQLFYKNPNHLQSVEQSLCELRRDKEVIVQNLEQSSEESTKQRADAAALRQRLEGDKEVS